MSQFAYLDGSNVFGVCVHVQHEPHPNVQQINEFFGVNGTQTVYGGTRGRTFLITGLLPSFGYYGIAFAENALLSFADGLPHQFTDTLGRVWSNVIYRGEYQPSPGGPKLGAGGDEWFLPYKTVLSAMV